MHNEDVFPIATADELTKIYGLVAKPSLTKDTDHNHPAYRPFTEALPRGDSAGFVHIQDDRMLLLPDRRGNNRIDSLKNFSQDPQIALLFLIPGVGETLRVNGTAEISIVPHLLERFAVEGKKPGMVLRIYVTSIFFLCSRAIIRSRLWSAETQVDRQQLPSPGNILKAISRSEIDGDAHEKALPERLNTTLY